MKTRASSLPTWSYPLLLALLGIVLAVGHLSPPLQGGVALESLLFLGYLSFRSRRDIRESHAVANLLPLFPGHLLLLFALTLLPETKTSLVLLWMVLPAASVLYDLTAVWPGRKERTRMSILAALYCIIWAVLFILLERVIALGRGLEGAEEIKLIVVFGVVGAVFLGVGAYRHWYASKLFKE
jgi:membrane protein DedA with SNARE-associated domain